MKMLDWFGIPKLFFILDKVGKRRLFYQCWIQWGMFRAFFHFWISGEALQSIFNFGDLVPPFQVDTAADLNEWAAVPMKIAQSHNSVNLALDTVG